jgi:hypothetical protein
MEYNSIKEPWTLGGDKMKTIRIIIIFLLAVFFSMIIYGKCFAATVDAASCSQDDVQTAIDSAIRGDTVKIPACAETTWDTAVTITKAITLQGAGAGLTNITGNITPATDSYYGVKTSWMIRFNPSSIADDSDVLLRITGFTFNLNYKNNAIHVQNISTTVDLNKVVIDNNTFSNCRTYYDSSHSPTFDKTIMFHGNIYGVVHSNTFSGWVGLFTTGNRYGNGGLTSFTTEPFSHGTSGFMFYEDNTISYTGTDPDQIFGGSWGGAYVVRYNTIDITQNIYKSLTDWHGNQPSGTMYGVRGGEMYGNKITRAVGTTNYTRISDMAGGKHLNYYNAVTTGAYAGLQVRETYIDHVTGYACPSSALYSGNYCSTSGQPQHVEDTYIWNNRYGATPETGTQITTASNSTGTDTGIKRLRQNYEYWLPNTNSPCNTDGTCDSGIGCGSATPTGNCTTGAAYWKTSNPGSCTNLTNLVGASHSSNISGTLYRCYPTNVWTVYYNPYTYPHPLRSDVPADTTAPSISNFSPLAKVECTDTSAPYTQDVVISIKATDQTTPITCKWDTSVDGTPTYTELSNTFTGSGDTFSATATLNCGTINTIYYACTDGTNASAVTSSTVEVGQYGDDVPATITNVSTTNQACSTTQKFVVTTDKQSTCKWDTADVAYASMANTFTSTVDTTHHEVSVTQNCSESVTRYVRCSTTQGAVNSSSTAITVTTDAAKSVTLGTGNLTIGIGTGTLSVTILP